MSRVVDFVAGFALGVAVAGGVWFAAVDDGAPSTGSPAWSPQTTTAPVVVEPDWIDEGGVRFASTVLVPTALIIEGDVVRLRYDLVPIGQTSISYGASLPGALPERWELRLRDGTIVEAVTIPPNVNPLNPGSASDERRVPSAVSFEAGGLLTEDIAAIAVTGWRVPVPVVVDFAVPPELGRRTELFDGSVLVLDRLLEQRSSTIVGFAMERPPDAWRTDLDLPFRDSIVFRGAGPGWVSSSSTIGGISGGGSGGGSIGFQLTWDGPQAPDPIGVEFATTTWLPVAGERIVPFGGTP